MSDIGERVLECSTNGPHEHGIAGSIDAVEKMVAYRRRLGQLTDPNQGGRGMFYLQWGTENVEVRDTTIRLASTIQSATTKVLMSSALLKNRWESVCHIKIVAKCGVGFAYDWVDPRRPHEIWDPWRRNYVSSPELKSHKLLSIVKNGEDQWDLEDRHELEAVLGLWAWSLNRHQLDDYGWGCRRTFNRRVLYWDKSPSVLGWQYWAGESKIRENRISKPDLSWNPRTIWLQESLQTANRFIPSTLSHYPSTEVLTQLFEWYSREPSLLPADMEDMSIWTLPTVVFEEFKANRTPLWHAARIGHEVLVNELLQTMQDDKDLQDWKGRTPLWQAAANGHDVIVGLLLAHGADTSSCDDTGRTPLIEATANGHRRVVQLLLQWGRQTWMPRTKRVKQHYLMPQLKAMKLSQAFYLTLEQMSKPWIVLGLRPYQGQ
ncbi:hypothetical protein DER45DRAFT_316029 [Fusarium avenaceum]|nr:hypothetical protein DER45DRAFT_316029 [Fusarium avenaceum]